MTTFLVIAWSTACVLTAVEELFMSLGRWRGLLALTMSTIGTLVLVPFGWPQIFYVLATSFAGLTSSVVVEQVFTGQPERAKRGLPKRIPPL